MTKKISKELIKAFKSKFNCKSLYLHEPDLDKNASNYLKRCVEKNSVSTVGNFVEKFENKISKLTSAKYVITTNSGTSALHISCILMGVKENDEVLVPAFTFVATANAVKYCNAIPHFVDIEENHFGIDIDKLKNYLKKITIVKNKTCINKITGKRIKAIIPVHVFGHPINIDKLLNLAKEFNLSIIEDAADALGSYYKSKHVGTFGNIGILSFNGNKPITCGAGGAILTNNKYLAEEAKHIVATAKLKKSNNFVYDRVGYNYRMPNVNAALGYSQIIKIKKILKNKRKLFHFYKKIFLKYTFIKLVDEPKGCKSNFWLQTILLNQKLSSLSKQVIKNLNNNKIYVRPGWELMVNLKHFANCPKMQIISAKKVYKRIINIPSSSFLINKIKKQKI